MKRLFSSLLVLLACSPLLFAQPNGKKILLEKITSVGCPGCPWGGYLIDSFLQSDTNIVPVAIHRHDHWHPDSMWTVDGDSILADYLFAHPTAMVDRIKFADMPKVSLFTHFWKDKIEERKLDPLTVTIGATTTYDPNTRILNVNVNGTFLWDNSGDIRVNCYVMESPVSGIGTGWDQLNSYNTSPGHPLFGLGDPIVGYQHKHVLRDMLGDHHGAAGAIPDPVLAGTSFLQSFQTTLHPLWNDTNVYVVVLVQRYDPDIEQRQILNCNRLGLNNAVATAAAPPQQPEASPTISPNPARGTSTLRFPTARHRDIHIRDAAGRHIRSLSSETATFTLDLTDLAAGTYVLDIRHNQQRKVLKLLVHP